jgi:hypothetical protein
MFIPDVVNTLLMGLIFMVVIVTVIRPFVLSVVSDTRPSHDMQKAVIDAVEQEMLRKVELIEAQRADKIKYQMLLLEVPPKPKPKPVIEPEPEVTPEPPVEVQSAQPIDISPVESEPMTEEVAGVEVEAEQAPHETDEDSEVLASGEIEIREGESLADIKERIRKEQQKAKKPTIPPELLNGANSYEDKVGIVRMVVQSDQSRVAAAIRGMIQIK